MLLATSWPALGLIGSTELAVSSLSAWSSSCSDEDRDVGSVSALAFGLRFGFGFGLNFGVGSPSGPGTGSGDRREDEVAPTCGVASNWAASAARRLWAAATASPSGEVCRPNMPSR